MPAQRPRAQFQPIPHNLDFSALVENNEHFRFCDRIPYEAVQEQGVDNFEKLVQQFVIKGGRPLVIEGFHELLDPWTFTPKWLRDNIGEKVENARDLNNKDNIPLTIGHYLKSMGGVANQHFRKDRDPQKPPQRIYLKDIDVPQVWQDKLQEVLPPFLFYFNDSTGEYGGPGADVDPNSTVPGRRLGRGIARSGDLMSCLPVEMRAENLMSYIGHEGTYTPAHREMCATVGQNIMVDASGDTINEDGKPERAGSSIWFMTEAKDRHQVAEYWLSTLGHDIEVEDHFAQINSWKLAPFNVYIVDQRPGDLVLVPPLAPHQVWNRGTRTMKVAWNRTTLETLEMALDEALPKARIVCRDEQYKNKAIIYYTLIKYSELLAKAKKQADKLPPDAGHALLYGGKVKQLQKDFKKLLGLFSKILLSEMFGSEGREEKCEYLPFDSNVTCAYCRGNIFNRFLSCTNCADALGHNEDEPYDVCMDCYAMGRSCWCISGHKFVEQFKWKELTGRYDYWRQQIIDLDGDIKQTTPLTLSETRRRYLKKTLAEVCREQLKKRPFTDVTKPKEDQNDEPSDEEVIVDDEGRVKKTVKKRSKAWLKNNSNCHVCCYRQPNWKMAKCTRCDRWWCYGSLFRGHDDMPLSVMEDPEWECAHCQGVCFVGACRRDPRQTPYQPKGTLLGHDTKRVADARSVETLVDFSVSNLNWIREDEQAEETTQMRRAREEAERARDAPEEVDDDDEGSLVDATADVTMGDEQSHPGPDNSLLDPALREESDMVRSLTQFNNTLPSPAAMIQGARPAHSRSPYGEDGVGNGLDGYAPATTTGYIAPTAVMRHDDEIEDSQYPDPEDMEDGETQRSAAFRPFGKPHKSGGARRKRRTEGDEDISMEAPKKKKKRRDTEDVAAVLSQRPQNEASRQYQNIRERKALDEAKRTGRFFAVSAALRGRKKIVRIKLSGARLAQMMARAANRHIEAPARPIQTIGIDATDENTDFLRSDIRPATTKARPTPLNPNKAVVRVEHDDDFTMRRDRYDANSKRKKHHGRDVEVVDVASDEDDYINDALDFLGNGETAEAPKREKRISAYLAARHEDDEGLPDALPENFKEPGRRRTTDNNAPTSTEPRILPARSEKGKWKSSKVNDKKPSRPSTGRPRGRPRGFNLQPAVDDPNEIPDDVSPDEDAGADDSEAEAPDFVEPAKPADKRKSRPMSITEEEKNRLAKLEALESVRDDPPVMKPGFGPASRRSIMDSNGPGSGKKRKIVSAATMETKANRKTM